jgi:glutamate--cysteine ligase catalytic subunit
MLALGADAAAVLQAIWHPEYANWMVEATPATPYGKTARDLAAVERNMAQRRREIGTQLRSNEEVLSLPVFPRLGAPGFIADPALVPAPDGHVSRSMYIPDDCIQPHPRFPTLTANIRKRRGEKVMIAVPVYRDVRTDETMRLQAETILNADPVQGPRIVEDLGEQNIYMDAMGFGMGASCLQVTLQASSVTEARTLYDQLAVVAPIMLALTAASPMYKGIMADTDARWNTISASVDDRTALERGVGVGVGAGPDAGQRLYKSRYSSIDCFIGESALNREELTDVPVPVNENALQRLQEAGIDARLARHVAHLFVRDPLVVYHEKLQQDNLTDNDHFENLQSTNWNTVRFKPPPSADNNPHGIQWRVEFRSMEVSLTDFENAAFSVFTILLARAITEQQLDLYMPISKIDANMEAAHKRDAVTQQRFWFRRSHSANDYSAASGTEFKMLAQLSLGEIFNGSVEKGVVGLLHRVRAVLDREGCVGEERAKLEAYLDFVGRRASGQLKSTATWMREYVLAHPEYNSDSVVTEGICHDLMVRCVAVSKGVLAAEDLVPLPSGWPTDGLPSHRASEDMKIVETCAASSRSSSCRSLEEADWGSAAEVASSLPCANVCPSTLRTGGTIDGGVGGGGVKAGGPCCVVNAALSCGQCS